MYLLRGSLFLWHGRNKHPLQRLHLAFGGHLNLLGGHGGQLFSPPQFLASKGIGPGLGSGGLGGGFGPGGIRDIEAVWIAGGLGCRIAFEHGLRVPKYLGCLHLRQHSAAAIKINN